MDATMENKIGMPPPYQPTMPNPVPPPPYFGNDPPPPPGFTAPPSAPRTAVITTPPPVERVKMGPGPTGTICSICHKSIVTRVDYVSNNRTHIFSAALCIVAGCCCGCLVPYCMRSCKTANHYCPECNAYVGTYIPS
ncbi:hypothetical protein ACJJTC_008085 [Scirpophaga incertulas]